MELLTELVIEYGPAHGLLYYLIENRERLNIVEMWDAEDESERDIWRVMTTQEAMERLDDVSEVEFKIKFRTPTGYSTESLLLIPDNNGLEQIADCGGPHIENILEVLDEEFDD